jgi:hypothetical protein
MRFEPRVMQADSIVAGWLHFFIFSFAIFSFYFFGRNIIAHL